jgi:hypothetical protein
VKPGDLVRTNLRVDSAILIHDLRCFDINAPPPPKIVGELKPGEIGLFLEYRELPPDTFADPRDNIMVKILANGVIGWCTVRTLKVIP